MPKQTKPSMVVINFRVSPAVKEEALARARKEGVNLSDVLRGHLETYAAGGKGGKR